VSRPAALEYVEVSTGAVLDTVTLVAGGLVFATGAAGDLFEIRRRRFAWPPAKVYDQLTGWSNGYVALRVPRKDLP